MFVPSPPKPCLAVIIATPADHDVPLYNSVQLNLAKEGSPAPPPKAKAAVLVPAPAN